MSMPDTVTVFSFHEPRATSECPTVAPYKASRESILQLGGEILEGTGETVDVDELRADGQYRRVATGWGALA